MKKYNGLLAEIAREFHIEQGKTESGERWKARIIYSLLGRMAYASLNDHLEENEELPEDQSISVTHFKRRISTLLDTYLHLYPEIRSTFPPESAELYGEIYDVYLKTGYMYHTPYQISPAAPSAACQGDVQFERGMALDRGQFMSGLGCYLPENRHTNGIQVYPSVQEMYGMQENQLSIFWNDLLAQSIWQPLHSDASMLYFLPASCRWSNAPGDGGIISIARSGQPGEYIYYLYQLRNGQLLGCQLPHWLVNDPFYPDIAHWLVTNACMASYSFLPKIRYHIDGSIVEVQMRYPLPPAELYWVKLYSWPQSFHTVTSNFKRTFSLPVFQAVKAVLEQTGYPFTEE